MKLLPNDTKCNVLFRDGKKSRGTVQEQKVLLFSIVHRHAILRCFVCISDIFDQYARLTLPLRWKLSVKNDESSSHFFPSPCMDLINRSM